MFISKKRPLLGAFLLFSTILFSSQVFAGNKTYTGKTMGTTYTIKVVSAADSQLTDLDTKITEQLNLVNNLMSTYKKDSELSLLNIHKSKKPFKISVKTAAVISKAVEICKQTGGVYDITVGPLVKLWGFGPGKRTRTVPSTKEIQKVKKSVGCHKFTISKNQIIKKDTSIYIDLSSIAKGFGVDLVSELIDSRGIKNYMVEVGGEVRTKGVNQSAKLWNIAIESPVVNMRKIHRVVKLNNLSMATSGDYRNYFEKDGKRFSHIINPVTGSPITHSLASVTILAPSCMAADAYATAMLVLGPKKGFDLAKKQNIAAFFIIKSKSGFSEKQTPEFEKIVSILRKQ